MMASEAVMVDIHLCLPALAGSSRYRTYSNVGLSRTEFPVSQRRYSEDKRNKLTAAGNCGEGRGLSPMSLRTGTLGVSAGQPEGAYGLRILCKSNNTFHKRIF